MQPMWNAPAVCELEGPRITGPRTWFRMLMAFMVYPELLAWTPRFPRIVDTTKAGKSALAGALQTAQG
jgi:hypothetical protein